MTKGKKALLMLGGVPLGAKFIFSTTELLGPQARKPSFEGQVLTVVGFKPRYVNNVLVRDENGYDCLIPLHMAERALKLNSSPIVRATVMSQMKLT